MCLSHLIYTVRPCLIHTCHAVPMPCSDHAVLLKATAQLSRLLTAELCCGLEKNGMVRAWHGRGMASVNQTRPHCVNQMGKTHSKPLGSRHGRGTAWARHDMCESALNLLNESGINVFGKYMGIFRANIIFVRILPMYPVMLY